MPTPSINIRDKALGDRLLEANKISREGLSLAWNDPRRSPQLDLCAILVSRGLLSPQDAEAIRLPQTANSSVSLSEKATIQSFNLPPEFDLQTFQERWRRTLGSRKLEDFNSKQSIRPAEVPTHAPPRNSGCQIIETLGQGGMGVVFRAEQSHLKREVAVKKIRSEQVNAQSQSAFLSEALTTAWLDHPNIVPIYDLWTDAQGQLSLSMKRVRGQSWEDLLKASDTPLDEHLKILMTVCNALAFAHDRGIAHCDLKPENIMVGEFGEVLVMDWGVAIQFQSDPEHPRARPKESVAGPFGTPSYMSPELADGRGQDIGPTTDVYLLGAILFELISGQPPHSGKGIMQAIIAASLGRIPDLPESTPDELKDICTRCLSLDGNERYPSVQTLRAALEAYLEHKQSLTLFHKAADKLRALKTLSQQTPLPNDLKTQCYHDYALTLASLRQSLELWDGNTKARKTLTEARLAYAQQALTEGDLGLASSQAAQLDPDEPAHKQLLTSIDQALTQEYQAKRQSKLLKIAVFLLLSALFVGLVVALLWRQQQLETQRHLTKLAKDARLKETAAKQQAQKALKDLKEETALKDQAQELAKAKQKEAAQKLVEILTLQGLRHFRARQGVAAAEHLAQALRHSDSETQRAYLKELYALSHSFGRRRVIESSRAKAPRTGKALSPDSQSILLVHRSHTRALRQKMRAGQASPIQQRLQESSRQSTDPVLGLYSVKAEEMSLRWLMPLHANTRLIWAPNSQSFLYTINQAKQLQLFVIQANDGQFQEFNHRKETGEDLRGLVWRPDSQSFAFLCSTKDQDTIRVGQWLKSSLQVSEHTVQGTQHQLTFQSQGLLVSAIHNQKIKLFSTQSQSTHTFPLASEVPKLCSWSPDGQCLALASNAPGLRLWNAMTGHVKRLTELNSSPKAVAWSGDSKRIAVLDEQATLSIWDALSAQRLHSFDLRARGLVKADRRFLEFKNLGVELDQSGQNLLLTLKHTQLWNLKTPGWSVLAAHPTAITAVQSFPDGRLLSQSHEQLQYWRLKDPEQPQTQALPWTQREIAIGPKGLRYVRRTEAQFELWHMDEGLIRVLKEAPQPVSVSWAPTGELFYLRDREQGFVFFKATDGQLIENLKRPRETFRKWIWSHSGRWLLGLQKDSITQLSAPIFQEQKPIPLKGFVCPQRRTGPTLLLTKPARKAQSLRFWSLEQKSELAALALKSPLESFSAHPEGRYVFLQQKSGVRLFDCQNKSFKAWPQLASVKSSGLGFERDSPYFAYLGKDRKVYSARFDKNQPLSQAPESEFPRLKNRTLLGFNSQEKLLLTQSITNDKQRFDELWSFPELRLILRIPYEPKTHRRKLINLDGQLYLLCISGRLMVLTRLKAYLRAVKRPVTDIEKEIRADKNPKAK